MQSLIKAQNISAFGTAANDKSRGATKKERMAYTNPAVVVNGKQLLVDGGNVKKGEFLKYNAVFKDSDGDNAIRLADGSQSKIKDLKFADTNSAGAHLLGNAAGMSAELANIYIDQYDGEAMEDYDKAFNQLKTLGSLGTTAQAIARTSEYNPASFFDTKSAKKILAEGLKSREFKAGLTNFATNRELINKVGDGVLSIVDKIGKDKGFEFILFDSLGKSGSEYNGAQLDGNRIMLSLDADNGLLLRTVAHEQAHFLKKFNKSGYIKLLGKIKNAIAKKDGKTAELIDKYITQGYATGESEENDAALEELVCDSLYRVYNNEGFIRDLANSDKKLAEQLGDNLDSVITSIEAGIQGLKDSGKHKEVEILEDDLETLKDIQDTFHEELTVASENYRLSGSRTKENAGFSTKDLSELSRGEFPKKVLIKGIEREYNGHNPLSTNNRASSSNPSSIAWVYKKQIFSTVENKMFMNAISAINSGDGAGYSKLDNGEYLIQIENKLVFTDGDYEYPDISKIIEFMSDSSRRISKCKEMIIDAENGRCRIYEARKVIDDVFRNEFALQYTRGADRVYEWGTGKSKGRTRREALANYLRKQNRAGNGAKSDIASQIANEPSSTDGGFSMPKFSTKDTTDTADKLFTLNREISALRRQIDDIKQSDEYKAATTQGDDGLDTFVKRYGDYLKSSGLGNLSKQLASKEAEYKKLQEQADKEYADAASAKEAEAIAKSGGDRTEYFRKSAVKEFGYTPYFYDAGYLLPNGKMLNFSGEKGKHFGTRGEDHRGIGIIYENLQGSDAMTDFMNMGNIRIMAESPGIDISTATDITPQQYSMISKFIRDTAQKQGFFSVDFSDENGRSAGNYTYEDNINPTKIVNDIKYFFENGRTREQSVTSQFHYSTKDTEYMAAAESDDTETAQRMVDEAAKEAGYEKLVYHGTLNKSFTVFDINKAADGSLGKGFYFSGSKEYAKGYTVSNGTFSGRVIEAYINIKNPYIAKYPGGIDTEKLKAQGYDGVYSPSNDFYILFDPSQIKSADPVTYDNSGNIIPLSERFNEEKEDIRYSFKGERAQNADLTALEAAKRMQESGENSEAIRQTTGWFKGYDGKWRYEIDDSKMKLTEKIVDFVFGTELGKLIKHNELFSAYPQLKSVKVRVLDSVDVNGSADPDENEIYINSRLLQNTNAEKKRNEIFQSDEYKDYSEKLAQLHKARELASKPLLERFIEEASNGNAEAAAKARDEYKKAVSEYDKQIDKLTEAWSQSELGQRAAKLSEKSLQEGEQLREDAKYTLIHEIQHFIQYYESFANGSNPEEWEGKIYDALSRKKKEAENKLLKYATPENNLKELIYQYDERISRINGDDSNALKRMASAYDTIAKKINDEDIEEAFFEYSNATEEFVTAFAGDNLRRKGMEYYRRTAGEVESRDVSSRIDYSAEQRKNTRPDIDRADVVFADGSTSYAIVEPFYDNTGSYFENAVLLDTDFFDGISPRNWGRKLQKYVEYRSENDPLIMAVEDENGFEQMLQFAEKNERVRKNGSQHKVLSKLYITSDNISKLSVIHIDEIVVVSKENNPYYTENISHGWLDKNGWLHRNANVINAKNGNIYNLTFDIAKAEDGRIILYATDGNIKKVGNATVNSLIIKGSRQNSNFHINSTTSSTQSQEKAETSVTPTDAGAQFSTKDTANEVDRYYDDVIRENRALQMIFSNLDGSINTMRKDYSLDQKEVDRLARDILRQNKSKDENFGKALTTIFYSLIYAAITPQISISKKHK